MTLTLANRNIVGIVAFCCVPFLIIGIIWFWSRRSYHPIAGRAPLLTIVANIILALVLLEDGFYLISTDEPCMLHWSWLLLMVPTAVSAVLARCFTLLMQFEVTKDICAIEEKMRAARQLPARIPTAATRAVTANLIAGAPMSSSGNSPGGATAAGSPASPVGVGMTFNPTIAEPSPIMTWKPNWYTTNRHMMQPRWLLRVLAIQFTVASVLVAISAPLSTDDTCRTSKAIGQNIVFSSLLALIGIEGIAMVIVSYKLAKFDSDGFGIKREFRWMGGVLGGAVAACALLWITTKLARQWAFFLDVILVTAITCWFLVMMVWPVYASYVHQRATERQLQTVQKINHLDRLLVMDSGFEAFLEFARGEFCSESPLFWRRVNTYRSAPMPLAHDFSVLPMEAALRVVTRDACAIFDTYLAEHSPFQVNISASQRVTIEDQLKEFVAKYGHRDSDASSAEDPHAPAGVRAFGDLSIVRQASIGSVVTPVAGNQPTGGFSGSPRASILGLTPMATNNNNTTGITIKPPDSPHSARGSGMFGTSAHQPPITVVSPAAAAASSPRTLLVSPRTIAIHSNNLPLPASPGGGGAVCAVATTPVAASALSAVAPCPLAAAAAAAAALAAQQQPSTTTGAMVGAPPAPLPGAITVSPFLGATNLDAPSPPLLNGSPVTPPAPSHDTGAERRRTIMAIAAMNVASPRNTGSPLFRSTPSPHNGGTGNNNGGATSPNNHANSGSPQNQLTILQLQEQDMIRLRSIFNGAQDTICHLMHANLFSRFRMSPIYEEWLNEYRGQGSIITDEAILGSRGPMQSRGEIAKKKPNVPKGKGNKVGPAAGRRGSVGNGDEDDAASQSGGGSIGAGSHHGSPAGGARHSVQAKLSPPQGGGMAMMGTWGLPPPPPLALGSPSQYTSNLNTTNGGTHHGGFLATTTSSGTANTTTTGSSMVTPRASMLGLHFTALPASPNGSGANGGSSHITPQSPSRNTTMVGGGGSSPLVGSPKVIASNRQSITSGAPLSGRAGAYAFAP